MPAHFWTESYSQQEEWVHIFLLLTISSPLFWAQKEEGGPSKHFSYWFLLPRNERQILKVLPQSSATAEGWERNILFFYILRVVTLCLSHTFHETEERWTHTQAHMTPQPHMLLMVSVPLLCTTNVYIELEDSTKFWAWKVRTLIRLQKSTSKPETQDAKNGKSSRDQEKQTPHLTFHSNSWES